MRTNPSDVHNPVRVIDPHDQAVIVSLDVENNAIATGKTGVAILSFDGLRRIPLSELRFFVPREYASAREGPRA